MTPPRRAEGRHVLGMVRGQAIGHRRMFMLGAESFKSGRISKRLCKKLN